MLAVYGSYSILICTECVKKHWRSEMLRFHEAVVIRKCLLRNINTHIRLNSNCNEELLKLVTLTTRVKYTYRGNTSMKQWLTVHYKTLLDLLPYQCVSVWFTYTIIHWCVLSHVFYSITRPGFQNEMVYVNAQW